MLLSDSRKILKERNVVYSNRVYRYFKGKLYYVLDLVIHTETEEEMVSYQALYPAYGMFVRPKAMFVEQIDVNRDDIKLKQGRRFELFNSNADEDE